MQHRPAAVIAALLILTSGQSLRAAGSVIVNLLSPQSSTSVAPGQPIDWQITAEVSEGDNAGLALILVDLVQSPSNPQPFELVAPATVPAVMQKFAAPDGFSNPTGGYTGTLVGNPGAWDLRQIGGAQNNFGQAGLVMGQVVNVDAGVGKPGPVVIAEGSFDAPPVPGVYTISLQNVVANTFDSIATPPAASPVSPAAALPIDAMLTFTVDETIRLRADLNCDGAVDGRDVQPFVLALVDTASFQSTYPGCPLLQADVNEDSSIDTSDVFSFVSCLLDNCE